VNYSLVLEVSSRRQDGTEGDRLSSSRNRNREARRCVCELSVYFNPERDPPVLSRLIHADNGMVV
jgi:hypothetical protein